MMSERMVQHTRGLEIKRSLERMQSHRPAFESNILLREQVVKLARYVTGTRL